MDLVTVCDDGPSRYRSRMIRPMIAALSVALLAACGGGGATTAATADGASLPDIPSLAEKIGCAGLAPSAPPLELFVAGSSTCSAFGDTLTIDTFSSNAARDQWAKVAGSVGGRFVVLDRVTIAGLQGITADAVMIKTGGAVQP